MMLIMWMTLQIWLIHGAVPQFAVHEGAAEVAHRPSSTLETALNGDRVHWPGDRLALTLVQQGRPWPWAVPNTMATIYCPIMV